MKLCGLVAMLSKFEVFLDGWCSGSFNMQEIIFICMKEYLMSQWKNALLSFSLKILWIAVVDIMFMIHISCTIRFTGPLLLRW